MDTVCTTSPNPPGQSGGRRSLRMTDTCHGENAGLRSGASHATAVEHTTYKVKVENAMDVRVQRGSCYVHKQMHKCFDIIMDINPFFPNWTPRIPAKIDI